MRERSVERGRKEKPAGFLERARELLSCVESTFKELALVGQVEFRQGVHRRDCPLEGCGDERVEVFKVDKEGKIVAGQSEGGRKEAPDVERPGPDEGGEGGGRKDVKVVGWVCFDSPVKA